MNKKKKKNLKKFFLILFIIFIIFILLFYYNYLFHSDNLFRKVHYYNYEIDKFIHPAKYNRTKATKTNQLKIITFNIWSGLDYKGSLKMGWYEDKKIRKKRFELLIEQLKKIDADIIALNEVNNLPWSIRKIAKALGYDYISYTGVSGLKIGPFGLPVNLKEGDAILAKKKYGLEFVDRIRLEKGKGIVRNIFSFHTDDATQALIGKIKIADKSYIIINTHLHASLINDYKTFFFLKKFIRKYSIKENIANELKNFIIKSTEWRKESSKILNDYIENNFTDEKIILCGDFNSTYSTTEMQRFFKNGFISSYIAYHNFQNIKGNEFNFFGLFKKFYAPFYTWDPDVNLNIKKYYVNKNNTSKNNTNNNNKEILIDLFKKESDLIPRKIDYILLKNINKKDIVKSKLIFTSPLNGIQLSDHFGIMTIIKLGK